LKFDDEQPILKAAMRPQLVLSAAALVFSVHLAACAPTVDPAIKIDLDRRLAEFPTSEETYPPSQAFLPMAFAVGHWTQHRIRDVKGAQLITNKLVGRDASGYWLESQIESYGGKEIVKMHVQMLNGRDPAGMEIRDIQVRRGDTIVDVAPADVPAARNQYQQVLDLLAVAFETDLKDDVRVPGGHFIGCYKFETGRPWGPWQKGSLVCVHPSVPLSGIVRALPLDQTGSMELVAFGATAVDPDQM
jgi:hypothetical protein